MKQVLQSIRGGDVEVADIPTPLVPEAGVLVRTIASAVSAGTERMVVEFAGKNLLQKARARPDLVRQVLDKARRDGLLATSRTVRRSLDAPMPLGYSLVGEVVGTGPASHGLAVGDLVACAGAAIANHAEFVAVPQQLCARLPDGFASRVPVEHAAFATLGAIAMHGFRLASPQLGERVAVIGLGLLGQLAVQIANAAGCRVFGVDLSQERVDLARQLGAEDACVRADAEARAKAFTQGAGFDVVLLTADASSNDPIELAGAIARDRAHVIAVGAFDLQLPRKTYFAKELFVQVSRSYGPGRYDPEYELHGRDYPIGYVRWTEQRNLESFVQLLSSGRLNIGPLVTHRFPIEQATAAYDVITGKQKEPFLGVLLTYPADASPSTRVPVAPSATTPVQGRVGVSLVGAGLFATSTLLPALTASRQVALRGIVSGQGVSARTAGKAGGFAFVSTDAGDVLKDADTHAVFVLTRHHLHATQTIDALRAGKHVFVEKPLCLTREELALIGREQRERPGQLLMVGFNRRFAPLAVQLREFARTGEPVVLSYRVNAGYLPPEHWTQDPEQGGGRLLGEGCHFIDFANWFTGEAPIQVYAQAMGDVGRYRQDNLVIVLTYPSGSVATVTYVANGDRQAGKERIEVTSGERLAILEDFRELTMHGAKGTRREKSRLEADKGHKAEVQHFLAAVAGREPAPMAWHEIEASMLATFAAQDSLALGEARPLVAPDDVAES
jgi:predicted dehydrogenase/threonine dehydrogenase-like Zn-dependent dehydrogenase